jgi:AraC family transcriptional regulator, melibiose operon regulatory protein
MISPSPLPPARHKGPTSLHERHFYSMQKAFGRFGIRIFEPVLMPQAHWHGHIEANFAVDFEMVYNVDNQRITLPPNRLVLFWAGVPHQLTEIHHTGPGPYRLCNIYLPFDSFLTMNHIMPLQLALIGRGMVVLPPSLCDEAQVRRWYADYRSGDLERSEVVKMDLNALFRRAALEPFEYLNLPQQQLTGDRELSSAHIRHVIAMVKHVLENLGKPLHNADVTAVTGLHENYALTLFSRVMQVPLKQFITRMRLMRARALLVESSLAITSVVEASGFSSISQFYAQFRAGYGVSPATLRRQYLQQNA